MRPFLLALCFIALMCQRTCCAENIGDADSFAKYLRIAKRYYNGDDISDREDEFLLIEGSAFVTGIVHQSWFLDSKGYVLPYRMPDDFAVEKTVEVILKYLDAHPKEWNGLALSIITEAFTEAYPNPDFKKAH